MFIRTIKNLITFLAVALLAILVSYSTMCQELYGFYEENNNSELKSSDGANNVWFGATFGRHSENLSIYGFGFRSGFYGALNLEYPFSNAVYFAVSLAYWQAQENGVMAEGEFIVDKAIKIGLGLIAFRLGALMCSINPTLGIEEMNVASSKLVSLEITGKVDYVLFKDMLRLSSAISYQTAGEVSVAGGEQYSFTILKLGIGINLTTLN